MAFVSESCYLNVSLVDAGGNKASYAFELDYADLAALSTGVTAGDIATILADLNGVTDAQIMSYSFGERFVEDTATVGGGEVENVALITAKIDGSPTKSVSLRIPAPVDGVFVAATGENRNVIDPNDADLLSWLGHFDPTGHILVSDGENIVDPTGDGAFKGKRIHRASRRG